MDIKWRAENAAREKQCIEKVTLAAIIHLKKAFDKIYMNNVET